LSRSDTLRISDILDAANQLSILVGDGSTAYDEDWMRQRAAERLLEIIGEASNGISQEFRSHHPEIPWRHVINLRNLVAHHYHRVDSRQLWTIATVNVPEMVEHLKTAVR
jgi:uncharacterized protein with HEPN domain